MLKGPFADSMVSMGFEFATEFRSWAGGQQYKTLREHKCFLLQFSYPPLCLFSFCIPTFIWKHYKLQWFTIISCYTKNLLLKFPVFLQWCNFIYLKALSYPWTLITIKFLEHEEKCGASPEEFTIC